MHFSCELRVPPGIRTRPVRPIARPYAQSRRTERPRPAEANTSITDATTDRAVGAEKEPTLIPPSGTGPSGRRSSKVPIIAAIVAGVLLIVGIRYLTTRDDDPTPGTDVAAAGGQISVQPPRDGCTSVNIAASTTGIEIRVSRQQEEVFIGAG